MGFVGIEDYQLQVNLVLRSITATTYDAISDVTGFESADTNLPGALGEVVVGGGVNETASATGLTAEGGLRQIKLSWTNPINNNYHKTLVYKTDSISGIVVSQNIGEVIGGESFVDTGGLGNDNIDGPFSNSNNFTTATRYYRVRAVDSNGDVLTGGSYTDWAAASLKRSDTDDVVNSAISQQAVDSNVTNAGSNLSTSFGTTGQLLGDITLETGNEVLLSWSVLADTDSGASEIDIQILRDSSQIYFRSDIRIPDDGDTMLISANFADSNVGPGQKRL